MLSRDLLASCHGSPAIEMALLREDALLYDAREQQICLRHAILSALGSNTLLLLLVWYLWNCDSLVGQGSAWLRTSTFYITIGELLLLIVRYLDSFVCGPEPFDLRTVGPRRKFLSVLAVM